MSLQKNGALFQCAIRNGDRFATLTALADIGANSTVLDEELARALDLLTDRTVQMGGIAMRRAIILKPFRVELGSVRVDYATAYALDNMRATAGRSMLLGRDLLAQCAMQWDGSAGRVELRFRDTGPKART